MSDKIKPCDREDCVRYKAYFINKDSISTEEESGTPGNTARDDILICSLCRYFERFNLFVEKEP